MVPGAAMCGQLNTSGLARCRKRQAISRRARHPASHGQARACNRRLPTHRRQTEGGGSRWQHRPAPLQVAKSRQRDPRILRIVNERSVAACEIRHAAAVRHQPRRFTKHQQRPAYETRVRVPAVTGRSLRQRRRASRIPTATPAARARCKDFQKSKIQRRIGHSPRVDVRVPTSIYPRTLG